tara:strand:+ start:2187 stop:2819 length:633 start_codon:yes stop_codon:yes gene_type:complete
VNVKNSFLAIPMTVAILLTGCSIPLDEEPRELSMNLPDALLPAASTTTQAPTPNETVKIFLAKANEDGEMKLEPVNREISSDGSINVILAQVLAGPTLAEQETQLVSPFAEGSEVIGVIHEEALLEIHLDSLDGFPQDDSKSNRLAFAMLVCTASELIAGAEISYVRIMVRQNDSLEAINAPVTDGDPPEEGAPVLCSNYASFMEENYFS